MIMLCSFGFVLQFYKAFFIDLSIKAAQSYMERGNSFEAQCHFARNIMSKEEYQGLDEVELERILKNRIKKFYATNDYIQVDVEHFKPRVEPLYIAGVEPSNDTLVLFGIDFMKKNQLKQYFADFSPHYRFLDESNCILTFPTPEAALKAIRANVRPDSNTKLKVEEDAELREQNISLTLPQPREWIQLTPYIYSHQKNKFEQPKNFQRRLYIRYATNKEKQIGFNCLSFLDELLNKCKQIWQNQAKNDANLRNYLLSKMNGFREAINVIKQREGPRSREQRSRSRDKLSKKPAISPQKPIPPTKHANQMQGVDEDLSYEIRSRSENSSDLRHLMEDFQQLNLGKEGDFSYIANISMSKDKQCNAGGRGFAEVGYKLIQPAQVRTEFHQGGFDYRKYLNQTLEKDDKKKMVAFYDLTEND